MSNLSQSVQIMLTARGINLKGNTDDLTTMINQEVIKAEDEARRKALTKIKNLVNGWVGRGWSPSKIRLYLFDVIDKLLGDK